MNRIEWFVNQWRSFQQIERIMQLSKRKDDEKKVASNNKNGVGRLQPNIYKQESSNPKEQIIEPSSNEIKK